MGIRGLTTLVENHPKKLLQNFQLRDTKLVIDGNGVLWHLMREVDKADPVSHGGEYERFRSKVHFFFQNFLKCNCRPYVVFDGSFDLDDKKLDTFLQRFQKYIRQAKGVIQGRSGDIQPPLMKDLMKQVLEEMGVNYANSQFEADREIALLANGWQCPVLGADSDFYIMDIIGGYIPLTLLNWKHVDRSRDGSFWISGVIYHIDSFCKFFHVRKELLPLFATLCGNDYVQPSSISAFLSQVYGRFESSPSKRQGQLEHLLHWISEQTSRDRALQEVWKHSPCKKVVEDSIKASIATYILTEKSSLKPFFEGDKTYNHETMSQLCMACGAPAWFAEAHQRGLVSNACMNMLSKRYVFSQIQVENPKYSSAWYAAKSLTSVVAGIVLGGNSDTSTLKDKKETCTVYIRNGDGFQRFQLVPEKMLDAFGELPSLFNLPALPESERMKLFLKALVPVSESIGTDIETVPKEFQLPLLVTIHWINDEHTQMSKFHVIALLLGWVYHTAASQQRKLRTRPTAASRSHSLHIVEAEVVRTNFTPFQRHLKNKAPDAVTSHCFAQWQNCMHIAIQLSGLLQDPIKQYHDISVVYNGLTVHSLYLVLKNLSPKENLPRWIASKLFHNAPKGFQLYESLRMFVFSHVKRDILLLNNGKKCVARQGASQQVTGPKSQLPRETWSETRSETRSRTPTKTQAKHQARTEGKTDTKALDDSDDPESDEDSSWATSNKFAALSLGNW